MPVVFMGQVVRASMPVCESFYDILIYIIVVLYEKYDIILLVCATEVIV